VLYGAARATANVNVDRLARTVEFVDLRIVKGYAGIPAGQKTGMKRIINARPLILKDSR